MCFAGTADAHTSTPRRCLKHVIVQAWPRGTVVPPVDDPGFEKWALCQLRLYKSFWTVNDLRFPSISDVFFTHLDNGGFPHLKRHNDPNEQHDNSNEMEPPMSLIESNTVQESFLQQDDYQFLINYRHVPMHSDYSVLLGNCEVDTSHLWLSSWNNFFFKFLVSWLNMAKKHTSICWLWTIWPHWHRFTFSHAVQGIQYCP